MQKSIAQSAPQSWSHYYTDFSRGSIPPGWDSIVAGYRAAIVDQHLELSISKTAAQDHYTLGELNVEDFDLSPYVTICYRLEEKLMAGITLMASSGPASPQEVFELPASGEWKNHTLNLSALATETWGNDLESLEIVFQPEDPGYTGSFALKQILIGDSVTGKAFRISLDQPPPLSLDLGPDTTLVAPATLQLDAGNPGSAYLWNTGETTQTIRVDTGGIYYVTVIGKNNCQMTDTIRVTREIENGIEYRNTGPWMNLFPNPAQHTVHLVIHADCIGSALLIMDSAGRIIESRILTGQFYSLDISHLSSGLYLFGLSGKSPFTILIKY